jgi:hypothetical protein
VHARKDHGAGDGQSHETEPHGRLAPLSQQREYEFNGDGRRHASVDQCHDVTL